MLSWAPWSLAVWNAVCNPLALICGRQHLAWHLDQACGRTVLYLRQVCKSDATEEQSNLLVKIKEERWTPGSGFTWDSALERRSTKRGNEGSVLGYLVTLLAKHESCLSRPLKRGIVVKMEWMKMY